MPATHLERPSKAFPEPAKPTAEGQKRSRLWARTVVGAGGTRSRDSRPAQVKAPSPDRPVDLRQRPSTTTIPRPSELGLRVSESPRPLCRSRSTADPMVDPTMSPQRTGETEVNAGKPGERPTAVAQDEAGNSIISTVTRHLDTVEVTGSIPVSPISVSADRACWGNLFPGRQCPARVLGRRSVRDNQ
jgi:hypothetical protein